MIIATKYNLKYYNTIFNNLLSKLERNIYKVQLRITQVSLNMMSM